MQAKVDVCVNSVHIRKTRHPKAQAGEWRVFFARTDVLDYVALGWTGLVPPNFGLDRRGGGARESARMRRVTRNAFPIVILIHLCGAACFFGQRTADDVQARKGLYASASQIWWVETNGQISEVPWPPGLPQARQSLLISPDQRQVALSADHDVYVFDVTSRALRRVTRDAGQTRQGYVFNSPIRWEGTHALVFQKGVSGVPFGESFVLDTVSGRVGPHVGLNCPLPFLADLPDGRSLLYCDQSIYCTKEQGFAGRGLYTWRAGEKARFLRDPPPLFKDAYLAADGDSLLIRADCGSGPTKSVVARYSISSGRTEQLIDCGPHVYDSRLSPSGNHLAYVRWIPGVERFQAVFVNRRELLRFEWADRPSVRVSWINDAVFVLDLYDEIQLVDARSGAIGKARTREWHPK